MVLFSHSLLAFSSQHKNFPSLWCSWFCNFHRYIGELFAPVPCKVSIYKSSPFHFGPVRTRILRLLAAMKNVVSPFHVCLLMQLHFSFPSVPPFPVLFHFQLTQVWPHFSVSCSVSVKGTVANSML